LTPAQARVRTWIKSNYGIISQIAEQLSFTPQYVHRIAYGHEARSKDYRVENALKKRGWPADPQV
jgi:hypothetical protein